MLSSPDTKNNIAIQKKSMAHNHPIDPNEFFVNLYNCTTYLEQIVSFS